MIFQCPLCEFNNDSEDGQDRLLAHVYEAHPDNIEENVANVSIVCPFEFCGIEFVDVTSLQEHIEVHHSEVQKSPSHPQYFKRPSSSTVTEHFDETAEQFAFNNPLSIPRQVGIFDELPEIPKSHPFIPKTDDIGSNNSISHPFITKTDDIGANNSILKISMKKDEADTQPTKSKIKSSSIPPFLQ